MGVKLNRAELAEHIGVSPPTLDRWLKEGMPVEQRGSRGIQWVFDLAEVIQWKVDRGIKQAGGEVPKDADQIEKRTATARMQMAELELAKAMGDVGTVRDFERAQAKIFAEIRANVMNVPQRVVLQLIGCTDESQFKDVLRAELTLALQAACEAELTLDDDEDAEGIDDE